MLSVQRQQAIGQLVAQHGVVNVVDLARQFGVSASTIRRDLEQLESQGQVRRIHGGAAAPNAITGRPALSVELEASRIGQAAARRVRPDETVFLGPGRLTLEAAKALAAREGVTVVTNCLEIAHWLANNARLTVVVTGGRVGRPRSGMDGPLVTHALQSLRADRVFIEAAGVSPDQGLMGADLAQAELCRDLIVASGEVIALASPERVGRVGGVWIAPAGDLDVIITGRKAEEALLWDLSQLGIGIETV